MEKYLANTQLLLGMSALKGQTS